MAVSIVIPVFNGLRFLPHFWERLELAAAGCGAHEYIVIDDGSVEPVLNSIPRSVLESAKIISHSINLGFSSAVNAGIRKAAGSIFILINTDVLLEKDSLAAIVRCIEACRSPAIIGAKLLFPTSLRLQHAGVVFSKSKKHHVLKGGDQAHPLANRRRSFQAVTFALAAFPSELARKTGLLDEAYFNRNEDIDYCLRARQHGFDVLYEPQVTAFHWESVSGFARFALSEENETLFWTRWRSTLDSDLGDFLRESLAITMASTGVADRPHQIINLSRGFAGNEVEEVLQSALPQAAPPIRRLHRQVGADRLVLHHALAPEHLHGQAPVAYIVDSIEMLSGNRLWFMERGPMTGEDIAIDHCGNVIFCRDL